MDLGDIILAVIAVGIWAVIFFSGYRLFRMKKNIEEKGSKVAFRKIVFCEALLIGSGIIQLWAVMYPPFAVYTWDKVYTGWVEKIIMVERAFYLLETVIMLPIAILVVGIMAVRKDKRGGKNDEKNND